jgi:hypothetical protein
MVEDDGDGESIRVDSPSFFRRVGRHYLEGLLPLWMDSDSPKKGVAIMIAGRVDAETVVDISRVPMENVWLTNSSLHASLPGRKAGLQTSSSCIPLAWSRDFSLQCFL